MGVLVSDTWMDQWHDTKSIGGAFHRESAKLRSRIRLGKEAPDATHPNVHVESGRYHLYVTQRNLVSTSAVKRPP